MHLSASPSHPTKTSVSTVHVHRAALEPDRLLLFFAVLSSVYNVNVVLMLSLDVDVDAFSKS